MAEQSAESGKIEGGKAEQSAENPILKYLGSAFFAAVVAFLTWLMAGSTELKAALTTLAGTVGGICALVTSLLYARYLGVLGAGAAPARSPERSAYVRLRKSLAEGGKPALIYAQWLTQLLDVVDRFFGDAGMADRTLFPHAFRLKAPAPLWTSPAFDRCLLLALIYPIVTIVVIWAASGHVGPAEAALALAPGLTGRQRLFAFVGLCTAAFACWRLVREKLGWKSFVWVLIAFLASFTGLVFGAGRVGLPILSAVMLAFAVAISRSWIADRGAGTITRFVVTNLRTFANSFAGTFAIATTITFFTLSMFIEDFFFSLNACVAGCLLAMAILCNISVYLRQNGPFLFLFSIVMILVCLGAADLGPRFALSDEVMSRRAEWNNMGSMLLFLGLFTLLNAPFDWASLGLTRALLRRGLELRGWWPFILALVDAVLAGVVITFLALTMVIGVQAFDDLAALGGGEGARLLPLGPFFDGIAANPTAPEFWWVYALLFSTTIPSIINLMIGGASLMRGVPGVSSWLLRFMPAKRAVPAFNRAWIATVLTLQLVGGAILGIVVQFALVYAVFGYVMPWLGLELLDMARALAAFDLPGKLIGGSGG